MGIAGRGTVALVGSGEFLPASEPLDRVLLERLPGPAQVAVLPTASAPDGGDIPDYWAWLGVEHFQRLGVAVDSVMLLTRKDAQSERVAERIATANFVYLSGGKPGYLRDTLRDTVCWRAITAVYDAGGVVVGCSASAMALAGAMLSFPLLWRTVPALNLVPDLAIIPHFDEMPRWLTSAARQMPWPVPIAGIEKATGLVVSPQGWEVHGKGSVTIVSERHATRYAAGQHIDHVQAAKESLRL